MPGNNIKIIAFGDIIGKPGRRALKQIIPELKKEYHPDIIIVNGENLAHNKGITEKILAETVSYGVDFFTLGDHAFDQAKEIAKIFAKDKYPIVRPANYPSEAKVPGSGWKIIKIKKGDVAVLNLMGRVFFREILDCPFRAADKALGEIKKLTNIIICDFHAEATSEKKAMGYHLDAKVSLAYGTHTHIPSGDEQILPQKTAYISDVGMTGPMKSIIGSNPENSIRHFISQLPFDYELSEDKNIEVNAIYTEIDSRSGQAIKIKRIRKIVAV